MPSADHPFVYPSHNAKLAQLVRDARESARLVELVILGDSKATGSGAFNSGYVAMLPLEIAAALGLHNTPASAWIPAADSNAINDAFIMHGASGGARVDITPANMLPMMETISPPNFRAWRVGDSGTNGICSCLAHDMRHTCQMFQGRTRGWCNRQGTLMRSSVAMDVLMFDSTHDPSVNTTSFTIQYRSNAEPKVNYFATLEASHTVAGTLVGSGWYRARTPNAPPTWANGYLQGRIIGPGVGLTPGVACVRWVNTAVGGIAVTGAGQGGARAWDIPTNHPNCGPFLKAMGADIIVVAYGANDAAGLESAATYKANVANLINLVRAALPDCVIILLSSDPRMRDPGLALIEEYQDRLVELCNEYHDVIYFNEMAMLNMLGFNFTREAATISGSTLWNSGTTYALDAVVHIDSTVSECVQAVSANSRTYWRSNTNGNLNFHPGNDDLTKNAWEPIRAYVEDEVHLTPLGEFRRAQAFAMLFAQASLQGNTPERVFRQGGAALSPRILP